MKLPYFPPALWLPFLIPTMHAASPQKECKVDTETAMEVGEFEEDSLTKPHTLPPRLIYLADRLLPDRRGTG